MRGAGHAASTGLCLTLALALASCSGDIVPRGRVERASKPPKGARPVAPPSMELRQCLVKLQSQSVSFTPLPDQNFGGGCSAVGSVKLLDIGVPATNLGAMTCNLAANFAAWSASSSRTRAASLASRAACCSSARNPSTCRRCDSRRLAMN